MSDGINMEDITDTWVARLFVNLLTYGTIFVPGYFLVKYLKGSNFIERTGANTLTRLIISCVHGQLNPTEDGLISSGKVERSVRAQCIQLVFCFVGLQVSYLTWGILQEKMMTKNYESDILGTSANFKDSQFLVFVNRVLAFIIAGVFLMLRRAPRHTSPLYKYSYCSFSNIMSSWFQYEALKYVSFPTQVLAKASKIIPTMLMGKIVSGKKYEYFEYVTAFLISVGMTMFLLGSTEDKGTSPVTTFSGIIILAGYMAFDSFTSNWQGELFRQHHMTSMQMMLGVNFFSVVLTCASLLQQGAFGASFAFMASYPAFLWDCIVLSICSAIGQLFIYHTIAVFGAVVFIIIMTIRQGLAILLSCIIYSHPITIVGIFGIIVVFGSIFLRVYCSHRLKELRQRRNANVEMDKV